MAQQRKVLLIVFIAEKRLHPTVAALGDMMRPGATILAHLAMKTL